MVEHPQFPPAQLSTQEITDLYLDRPRSIIHMDLGPWFCLATGTKDQDLSRSPALKGAMFHIQTAGYDSIPHLAAKLSAFNEFNKD